MRDLDLRHVALVVKREYLEIVRNKWFVVMTILTPFLMIAWSVVPSLMMSKKTSIKRTLVIVTADAELAKIVTERLEDRVQPSSGPGRFDDIEVGYTLLASADTSETNRAALQQQIDTQEIDGFLWLDERSVASHKVTYTARFTRDISETSRVQVAVRDALRRHALLSLGVTDLQIDNALKPVTLELVRWENGRPNRTNFLVQLFTLLVLGLTMFLTVMLYGMSVMRAVLEEKANRVMEVLLSSLSATELMMGKIIGVGCAGLTQVAIWTALSATVITSGVVVAGTDLRSLQLGGRTAIFFLVFFLLGFFLYSTLSAAVGAMVNSEREAQQIQPFVMMPLGISFAFIFFAMRAPDDPLIAVMSMVPFFAPMLMYMRIIVQTPPVWQIALSIGLMIATIVIMFFIAGRIYRVGVLMYGKRVSLPEIMKWFRYA